MTKIELKPCPFCGGEALLYADNGIRVICSECGASSQIQRDIIGTRGCATLSVIKAWNRRN